MNKEKQKQTTKQRSEVRSQKSDIRGITLIALIITIIIMLILVGVSIQMLIQSGLFNSAKIAGTKTDEAYKNEANLGNKVTINGEEYNSIEEYIEYTNGGEKTINWEAILADATANPEKYKHEEQSSTNGDIGIGTDGKPVNLDLWTYIVINDNNIALNSNNNSTAYPGYENSNIVYGKIIGTVPQYIKIEGNSDFFEVTSMKGTFYGCTGLTTAPEIPTSVTNMGGTFNDCTGLTTAPEIPTSVTDMDWTFYGCTGLTTAPEIPMSVTDMSCTFSGCTGLTTAPAIPSSVTEMYGTFYGCTKLQGTIEINANPTYYGSCFSGAATEGSGLVVTGSSTMLDTLIGTKSSNSNITKGT